MNLTKIDVLGSGGLARVWKVRDENGKFWALKELMMDRIVDSKMVARFRQEIRIQASLNHPNIVPVVAANVAANPPFYVMPVATCSLMDEILNIVTNRESFQSIAKDIIDALTHAHAQGIWHRDLKPKNVLRIDGKICIADFGLGKATNIEASYNTTTGDDWRTEWYAPPEQDVGLIHCDHRSDIYSLGKLFLHCLAGARVGEIPEGLDTRWVYIIRKCIRDAKEKRWQSMSQLQQQFDAVFGVDEPMVIDPEGVLQKISELAILGDKVDDADVRSMLGIIARIGQDEILVRQVFDRLPENFIRSWSRIDVVNLLDFIKKYDDFLPRNIDFKYCDTIANQYTIIYQIVDNIEIRELIRKRLFDMGHSHNRYYVGSVLAEIVATVREPAEIVQVIDLIRQDSQAAEWHAGFMRNRLTIDQRIRDALPQKI